MLKRTLFPKYPTFAGLKKDSQDYNGAGRIPPSLGGTGKPDYQKNGDCVYLRRDTCAFTSTGAPFYSVESIFDTLHFPI